ncbi:MAG: cellulase family glycosylhydrolase [Rhodospirillales bacterium]|nr:cellulase family glycosylhydrolase [Rhodospirillales bacterium]
MNDRQQRRRRAAAMLLSLTLLLVLAKGAARAAEAGDSAPGERSMFVKTSGTRFVSPDGRPLLLKGINIGNWLVPEGYMFDFKTAKYPSAIYAGIERILGKEASVHFWQQFRDGFVTQADIELIAGLGFNTIRVPFHWKLFVEEGKAAESGTIGYELLDRVVGWSKAVGLRVVIDMHAAPGGQTGINHDDGPGYPLMFYVPAHQDLTIAIWKNIARHYHDEPAVLGYDLLNEPIAPYHDVATLNPKLEAFYRRVVAAVREVDPSHVIFLGGGQWNTNFSVFGPPFDSNAAYTYHTFWSYTRRVTIQKYLNFSNMYDVPIWLGESGEADNDWIEAFRSLHERYNISWCFWTYKNMTSPATVVSVRRPRDWNAVVAIADQTADSDDETRRARVALAEFLENIRLENGTINRGFVQALGLKAAGR